LAARHPQHALRFVGLAFAPLAVVAIAIGAGRRRGGTADQLRA
jgi:hypothetical protein